MRHASSARHHSTSQPKNVSMKIMALSSRIPWHASHSGYGQLAKYLRRIGMQKKSLSVEVRDIDRDYLPLNQKSSHQKQALLQKHWQHLWRSEKTQEVIHLLYLEASLWLFRFWPKAPPNWIATIHYAQEEWWRRQLPFRDSLKRLSSAIVLAQKDLAVVERYVGRGRARFIRYGVDTEFFHPAHGNDSVDKPILFVGQYGRNFSMLYRIVLELVRRHPHLQFVFVVPAQAREKSTWLRRLMHHPSIEWRQDISDVALRRLYQKSALLLLPMNRGAAVTALVEALSCGLPPVTTDVGGVRDYGGGTVYPTVRNNDDSAMLELAESYLASPAQRDRVAQACRKFSQQHLAWPLIAQAHLKAYRELAQA